VLTDADRALAGDLVQAAFEATAPVWGTLRDLPPGRCHGWLRDTLAAAAQRQTGHPAGCAFVSPSHQRLTELKMARFGAEYDAEAGRERFVSWLRTPAPASSAGNPPGDGAAGSARPAHEPGARLAGPPVIGPASLRALPDGDPAHGNDARRNGNGAHGNGAHGQGNGIRRNGIRRNGGPGGTSGTGAAAPQRGSGDPVTALYEQHYASLVRLAALLVRDKAIAEEIVQDSFVAVAAAWRRRGTIDGALDFLRQSVLDRSRSAMRHRITAAPAAGRPPVSVPLLAALGELPARQREVLVLRYYANLSEKQAADTIGISRAAVRRHATRANAALRTLLDAG
jgi:DNA-directed RNA polymerase specialized sigma24 family protein